MSRAVLRDGLTGAANRLAFQQCLEACYAKDGEPSRRVSIPMIDVDLFKAYNDHYGHLAGDNALRAVAACLLRSAREPEDLVCRYGGEEFAIVLSDAPVSAAVAVARRFHVLLVEAAVPHATSPVAGVVTASIGVASAAVRDDADITRVIAAADEALYQAKGQGRNRTVLAGAARGTPRQGRTVVPHPAAPPPAG